MTIVGVTTSCVSSSNEASKFSLEKLRYSVNVDKITTNVHVAGYCMIVVRLQSRNQKLIESDTFVVLMLRKLVWRHVW